jgi:exodeoxyribonuclease-3
MQELGYQASFFGQKSHYGVAILSRQNPENVIIGMDTPANPPVESQQRRLITASFSLDDKSRLHVVNGYFPQGESRDHPEKFPAKRDFYAELPVFLDQHFSPDDQVVVLGDMNVAPLDADVGIGADNAKRWIRTGKCCFLPEEREWLQSLMNWGLIDSYDAMRDKIDEPNRYSWFDYRSKGFDRDPRRGLRIDLILVSRPLTAKLKNAGISYSLRAMDKPSDHCPVWIEI